MSNAHGSPLKIAPDRSHWGTEIAGKVKAWAKALTGPTSVPDKYPQLLKSARVRDWARTDRHLGQIDELFRRCVRLQVSMDDEFEQAHSV